MTIGTRGFSRVFPSDLARTRLKPRVPTEVEF